MIPVTAPSVQQILVWLQSLTLQEFLTLVAGVIGFIATVFCSGWKLGSFLSSREIQILKERLNESESRPMNTLLVNAGSTDIGPVSTHLHFSFSREPYINPVIVEELIGWLSDGLPTFASIVSCA